jgi:hypothetical protein
MTKCGGRGAPPALEPHLAERLVADVGRCVRADRSYSPYGDLAKTLAGVEHELRLCRHLDRLGVAFWSEADLRTQGLHKTPDVRLQAPLAVWDAAAGRHRVVTWIDSKATFGDDRTHEGALGGQYATYVNRYGPGLVIYWLGFLADLGASHPDVMLAEAFPPDEHICTLPTAPAPLPTRPPAGAASSPAGASSLVGGSSPAERGRTASGGDCAMDVDASSPASTAHGRAPLGAPRPPHLVIDSGG